MQLIRPLFTAGQNPDDPNGVLMTVEAKLEFSTEAEPYASGIGLSDRSSPYWENWEGRTNTYQKGRVLTEGGTIAGTPTYFYAEKWDTPKGPLPLPTDVNASNFTNMHANMSVSNMLRQAKGLFVQGGDNEAWIKRQRNVNPFTDCDTAKVQCGKQIVCSAKQCEKRLIETCTSMVAGNTPCFLSLKARETTDIDTSKMTFFHVEPHPERSTITTAPSANTKASVDPLQQQVETDEAAAAAALATLNTPVDADEQMVEELYDSNELAVASRKLLQNAVYLDSSDATVDQNPGNITNDTTIQDALQDTENAVTNTTGDSTENHTSNSNASGTSAVSPPPPESHLAGEFGFQCAKSFSQVAIKKFSTAAQTSLSNTLADADFFLPFSGKVKYQCEPPEGMSWADLSSHVENNKCLPCYELDETPLVVGNTGPPPICRHRNELLIKSVHPNWDVTHSPLLDQNLKTGSNMETWGTTVDTDRHSTCNYVGCANPHLARESSVMRDSAMRRMTSKSSLSRKLLVSGEDTTQTTWHCATDNAVQAVITKTINDQSVSIKAQATTPTESLGFSELCAKDLLSTLSTSVKNGFGAESGGFESYMSSGTTFAEKIGWNTTVRKVLSCRCAGYHDEDGQGGTCRQWDQTDEAEASDFWCYTYGACEVDSSKYYISAETTMKTGVSGMKKLTGCCADHHLYEKECPQWAAQGRCTFAGDVKANCPKSCGVCQDYLGDPVMPEVSISLANSTGSIAIDNDEEELL